MQNTLELTEEQKTALKRFGKEDSPNSGKTADQLAAEKEAEEKRLADEETKRKEEEERKAAEEKKTTTTPTPTLTDEQLLELASQKAGRKISSWEELKLSPSAEDEAKKKEQRDADKISWGLKNGKFNKKELENFIVDSKDPKGVAYRAYAQIVKEANPEMADTDIEEQFKEKYGLDKDENSWQYKAGQKELALISSQIIDNTYRNILNLDSEYDVYEKDLTSTKSREEKILAAAPVYKEDISNVISSLQSIEIPFSNEEKYTVPVSKEMLDAVKESMLEEKFVSDKILSGYKKEDLEEIAATMIKTQYFGTLAHEAAKLYHEKNEKGVRGIPEKGNTRKTPDGTEHLTEEQQRALKFFNIDKAPVSAN